MIRPVLFSFLVRFSAAILNFLVVVILSNALGPIGKGICSKYITIIANALIFCDFIGGPPLVYLSAKYRVASVLIPSYVWSFLTSIFTILIFFLFDQFPTEELVIMIILSFLNSCIAIHQNILSGKLKFYQLNIVILLQSLTLFFSLKYLFSASEDYLELSASPIHYLIALGFSYGIAAMTGFLFIINLEKTGKPIRLINFLKEAFRYGFVNILGHGLQFINQRLSYYMLNVQTLGIFSNVSSIGESLWLIPNSLATVQYGKISNTQDEKEANAITLLFLKANLLLCVVAAIIMVFIPDDFFVWLFGPDFSGIGEALIILVPGLFLFSGYLIIGHHFSGRGKFILNLKSIAVGLVITITGFIVFSIAHVQFTAVNIALLTTLSYSGNFIYAFFVFYKSSKFNLMDVIIKKEEVISLVKGVLKKKKPLNQTL
jgi:O-antigen/teichoic acid export membrane protein